MRRRFIGFVLFGLIFLLSCGGGGTITPRQALTPDNRPFPSPAPIPTDIPRFHSSRGEKPVKLAFNNKSSAQVTLKWVDFNGAEDHGSIFIDPHSSRVLTTNNTYAWRVYESSSKKSLGEVMTSDESFQLYDIGEDGKLTAVAFPPIPAAGERAYFDRPDDADGLYQIHIIYALFNDDKDRQRDTDGSISNSINLVNKWFKEQTDGSTLRFDTYQGRLDITFLQFDISGKEVLDGYRGQFEKDNTSKRLNIETYYFYYLYESLYKERQYIDQSKFSTQPGKYYIFYIEKKHPNRCGLSPYSGFPGVFFLGTQGCGYGKLGFGDEAWSTEFVLLHETLHGIGFTPVCSPHHVEDNPHHVNDDSADLMYPYVNGVRQPILDVGHDDYYKANIPGCPDLSNSVFLDPLPENPELPTDWDARWKLP